MQPEHRKPFRNDLLKTALKMIIPMVFALLCCALSTTFAEEALPPPPKNLDEAVLRLTETLVQQGNLQGLPVLISANDLYESQSRLSLPLAIQLRGKLITEMKQRGCRVRLPEDGCSYDLVVTEPYGTDRVWVVAAESRLDFPGNLAGDWSNAKELVIRLRTRGLSGRGGYAEAQVKVVTGP